MHSRLLKITLLSALSVLLAFPAWAEPPGVDGEDGTARRAEMLKKIRMVRMYSLTEALDLDEATAAKLFPYLRKHDSQLEELQQRKHKSHRALRKMVKNNSFDEKAADSYLREISDANIAIATVEGEQLAGLGKILSTEQRVNFLLAKAQFERKIREIMRDERQRRRGKKGERGGRGDRGDRPMGGPPPGR